MGTQERPYDYDHNEQLWSKTLGEWGYYETPKSLRLLPADNPRKPKPAKPVKKRKRPPLMQALSYLAFLRDYEQWIVKEANLTKNDGWFYCTELPVPEEEMSAERQQRVLDWLIEQGYIRRRKGQQLMHLDMTAAERKRSWLRINYSRIWLAIPRNPNKSRPAVATPSANGDDRCLRAAMRLMRILQKTDTPPSKREDIRISAAEIAALWQAWTTAEVPKEAAWKKIERLLDAYAAKPKTDGLPDIQGGKDFRLRVGWLWRVLIKDPEAKKKAKQKEEELVW
jgi:hypothetical protein